VHQAGN